MSDVAIHTDLGGCREARMLVDALSGSKTASLQQIFATRALRAVLALVQDLDGPALETALAAPSDFGALLEALDQQAVTERMRAADPLAGARLRGARARRAMLEAEGGVLGATDVAELLGISRQAVDKRRRAGHLLAVPQARHGYAYPAWQFETGGVMKGLSPVLSALQSDDPWSSLAFFLAPAASLGGARPLDSLRSGGLVEVLRLAGMHGEHGPD